MSKETLKSFLSGIDAAVANDMGAVVPEDFDGAVAFIGSQVQQFLEDNHLVTAKKMNQSVSYVANESYDASSIGTTLGGEAIVGLVKNCKISGAHLGAASKKVGSLLVAVMGNDNASVFGAYGKSTESLDNAIGLETLFPSALIPTINDVGMEAFGIQMDRVQPDLKVILTVALLQFHTSLTPRVVPVSAIGQGNVTITRETLTIHDLSEPKAKPIRMINLYKDPSPVATVLKRIVPLTANDDVQDPKLVADGIYKFQKVIDMFELALDPTKPGYEKYNHTDFVEDNIFVDGLYLNLTKAAAAAQGTEGEDGYVPAEAAVSEQFFIKIPQSKSRLTQPSNVLKSTDRYANIDRFPVILNKDSKIIPATANASDASEILGALTVNQGIMLNLNISAHVDRENSHLDAKGFVTVSAYNRLAPVTADEKAFAARITVDLVGFTLDARYNEDNKRKSNIRGNLARRSMSYELPGGRNFVMDNAIGADGMVNAAARLAQLEHIGRDAKNLDIITGVMNEVHDEFEMLGSGEYARDVIGAQFAAGDIVNPYTYVDTLDFSEVVTIRSGDASGDIKQFVKTKLTKITSDILTNSFYAQQLAETGKVTFRVVTSHKILGNAIQARHYHEELECDAASAGGVEHVVELDNGVRLEFVTTTFDNMLDRMILLPFLSSNQSSVLNFGTDYDQGTMIGNFTNTDGGAVHQRIFSVTRELLIPTNVIGAILDVIGLDGIL